MEVQALSCLLHSVHFSQVIFSLGRRDAVPLSHIVAGCQAVRRGCSLPLDVVGKGMKPRVWLGGTS